MSDNTSFKILTVIQRKHQGARIRKKWDTPKLVVLTRGTSAENVLLGCKLTEEPGASPSTLHYGCKRFDVGAPSNCGMCSALDPIS